MINVVFKVGSGLKFLSFSIPLFYYLVGSVVSFAEGNRNEIVDGVYIASFDPTTCGKLTVNSAEGHSYSIGRCNKDRTDLSEVRNSTDEVQIDYSGKDPRVKIISANYDVFDISKDKIIGQWELNGDVRPILVFNLMSQQSSEGASDLTAKPSTKGAFANTKISKLNVYSPPNSLVFENSSKAAIRCVQAALNIRNFNAGSPDGVLGRKTTNAINLLVSKTPDLANLPPLTDENAHNWCLAIGAGLDSTKFQADNKLSAGYGIDILNIDADSRNYTKDLSKLERENFLKKLESEIKKELGAIKASQRYSPVVYVLWDGVYFDDAIDITWGFRRSPDQTWFKQVYSYKVDESFDLSPLVIINETYAEVTGEFLFQVRVNNKLIGEKYVPVF